LLLLADALLGLLAPLLGAECDAELRDDLCELPAAEPEPASKRLREQFRVRRLDELPGLVLAAHLLARPGLAAGRLAARNLLGLPARLWLLVLLARRLRGHLALLVLLLDVLWLLLGPWLLAHGLRLPADTLRLLADALS